MREKMVFKIISFFICFNFIFYTNYVESKETVVQTTSGLVKGNIIEVLNHSIKEYLGIPYAEPPIGSLRFAKPKPIEKSNKNIIDATKPKYSCIQPVNSFVGNLSQSEDCLTLNIWAKKDNSTKLKPVLFWIYGGALTIGSIFQPIYNGSVLATHDVVIVSVNYRLGKLGFFYGGDESTPGNVGFYDQDLGLKWVRDNIHTFGGDKDQITIFGESAGSWSVSAHLLSPHSKGLFKRAIMQSGALMFNKDRPIITKEESLVLAKQTAKQLNCTADKQWLECLRKVDANKLIPKDNLLTFAIDGTEYLPLTAHKSFEELKFNKNLDLMAGVTRDEGTILTQLMMPDILAKKLTQNDITEFFKIVDNMVHNLNINNIKDFYFKNLNISDSNEIKWKIGDSFGDLIAKCPTYHFAKRYAEHSIPDSNIYFYELTHTARGAEFENQLGIAHGTDIDFVFGLILMNPNTTKEDIDFSKQIMKYWTDFAKFGKPDTNWSKLIDTKTQNAFVTQIKELNPKTGDKYFKNLFEKTCDGFWKNYY